jgi:hypothetical protein
MELVVVIVAITAVIIVAVLVGMWYAGKKRAKDLQALAASQGYEFVATRNDLLDTLQEFSLFTRGRWGKATNLLGTKVDGAAIAVFDYAYTVTRGTGRNRQNSTHNQSVLVCDSERLDLPAFRMEPEGLFERLGSAMGAQDIDFAEHPAFSKAFVLQGSDEAQLRALFGPDKLEYFAAHKGMCVEGHGRRLILYRHGKRVPPKEIPAFVEQGRELLRLLAPAA